MLAQCLIKTGQVEEGQALLAEIPEDQAGRYMVLEALGRHEDAIKALEARDPKRWNFFHHFFLGETQMKLEDWEGAAKTYGYLADRYTAERYFLPTSALVYYRLGVADHELGRTQEAVEQLERFLALWDNADPGLSDVADARLRLNALQATP
jgi:tetratricopeptide (TPR) repeat protein